MTTQTAQPAQNSPTQNKSALITLSLLSGAFLVYAIQSHLITDAFIAFMSLFFDQFTVKSSGIFPDIALLVLAALLANGAYSLVKNHFAVMITGAILAVFAALVWGA